MSSFAYTTFVPSLDSRIVYVSDSAGNDGNDGLSELTPKQTVSAGIALLRTGFPDWLLLKCGDTWTNQQLGTFVKSGRGGSEKILVATYGTGARPYLKTNGTTSGIAFFTVTVEHLAVSGIRFHSYSRPGNDSAAGAFLLQTSDDILFEDCLWQEYCNNVTVQADDGDGTITNVAFRRCVFVDSYSTDDTHSQGTFLSGIFGLLVEECIYDQNGWAGDFDNATIFNHNSYISDCHDAILRGNLYLRGSSMGTKFSANQVGSFVDLAIEGNCYIDCELGISAGGNEDLDLRFINVTIKNNVMMHLGRLAPTGRDVSWGCDVQDWDGGLIDGNLILHNYALAADNGQGFFFTGNSERNILVQNNITYGLQSFNLVYIPGGSKTGNLFLNNSFQDPVNGSVMVVHDDASFAGATYQNNKYFSSRAASSWFEVDDDDHTFAEWNGLSGETGSSNTEVDYPDPDRDEESYMASLGLTPTLAAFATAARAQSKAAWDNRFTAEAMNAYVREGFGLVEEAVAPVRTRRAGGR